VPLHSHVTEVFDWAVQPGCRCSVAARPPNQAAVEEIINPSLPSS